ncbi:MAG: hypothetical protein AVDCRST_MAG56-2704 [uncultured Cytophagales bacterium]|uniref:Uncharacterized protein n=1 Tax=uncultured Cytophagales bacterium TaxID=158755 RepID=A0A6J4IWV2_9SPHI|nr:MAG: hypothetical protein AVDCRST_MAG56-2704 [uncultured Cytophagales bacterium]
MVWDFEQHSFLYRMLRWAQHQEHGVFITLPSVDRVANAA